MDQGFSNLGDVLKGRMEQNKQTGKKYQATHHQQIAVEIAEAFDDMKNIGRYMRVCKKNKDLAHATYIDIMERPNVRNKAAYFFSLMKGR